jgi:hypothetical protein
LRETVNALSFALLGLVLLLDACGSNPRASAPPAFTPVHQEAVCPSGCIAAQAASYLELRLGPTSETAQDGFTVTLSQPLHIVMLDGWIGTQSGQIFESDSRLQIVWPSGDWREYLIQYDKHTDAHGEKQRSFTVDLNLPVGTSLTVYHSQQGVISCPQGCGYDTTWRFYATP